MFRTFLLTAAVTLAACSTPDVRVADGAAAPAMAPVSIRYASVEVALATMPSYAQSEEIFVQDEDGTLGALGPLWSDDPGRQVTLQVAQDLGAATGQLIAPEPWPFRDFAEAKLDIRITDFFVTADGTFRLSGQYFVAPEFDGPNVAQPFVFDTPIGEDTTLAGIAKARTAAVRQLSIQIAENGLR